MDKNSPAPTERGDRSNCPEGCGKPQKLRHTAKRIYEQLKEKHGFAGVFTIVKDHVRKARHRIGCDSSPIGARQPSFESEDPAQVACQLIQSVPKRGQWRSFASRFGSISS
jgi:hypothetical protein